MQHWNERSYTLPHICVFFLSSLLQVSTKTNFSIIKDILASVCNCPSAREGPGVDDGDGFTSRTAPATLSPSPPEYLSRRIETSTPHLQPLPQQATMNPLSRDWRSSTRCMSATPPIKANLTTSAIYKCLLNNYVSQISVYSSICTNADILR
jgi:hypothetical protein